MNLYFRKSPNYLNDMTKNEVGNFTKDGVFQTLFFVLGIFFTLDKTLFRTLCDTDGEITIKYLFSSLSGSWEGP